MKFSKRVLSLLLLVTFVVANTVMPAFAAGFSDVEETSKYSKAITTLNTLGVINGYEDGTFKPDNNVTRAEFTAMLLRAKGVGDMGDTSLENPPYPDVVDPDVSWAIANIRTAQSMGIVNGYEDGTFRPSNNVLYEEALKMIVCALGYANYSPEGTEWYTKYLTSATKLGILKGVEGSVSVPATRANIAQMLYNCLEIDVAEDNESSGKTWLQDSLKLTQKTGIIYSNKVTSLTSPNINLRSNEILIKDLETGTTDKYTTSNAASYGDLIGRKVQYYYEYDRSAGANVLSSLSEANNSTFEINAKDLEPSTSTSSSIKYYKDGGGKEQSVNVSADSLVIYNDKLYGSTATASTYARYFASEGLPTIGSLKLLDNDYDGTYDIVFVDDYDVYVVDTASTSTYTVTDKILKDNNGNARSIVLDPNEDDNLYFVDTNGTEVGFSSISKGATISVKKSNASNGGDVITTVVVNKSNAKGKVSGLVSGESITVGGTTYKYSSAAPWIDGSGSLAEPQMGDSATFYLDLNGDVVAYDKSTSTDSNQKYGYLIKGNVSSKNMEDTLYLTILSSGSGSTRYTCDKNTKINGSTYADANALLSELISCAALQAENIEKENENAASQVVKFTLKSDNTVDEIVTAQKGANVSSIESDKLVMSEDFTTGSDNKPSTKYTSSTGLTSTSGKVAKLSGATMFYVPKDRSDEDDFKILYTSDLKSGSTYHVEVFDMLTTNMPKVIVFYNMTTAVGEVNYATPVFVVTEGYGNEHETGYAKNGSNGTMYKLCGYEINTSGSLSETHYWIADDSASLAESLKVGDVVRLGKDSKGFSTLKERDILYGVNVDRDTVISLNDISNFSAPYDSAVGSSVAGQYYIVDDDNDTSASKWSNDDSTTKFVWGTVTAYAEGTALVSDGKQERTYESSRLSGAKVLILDNAASGIQVKEETAGVGGVFEENLDNVFMYVYGNNVRLVIVRAKNVN